MLSTDMLLSEVKAKILPNCYAKLCKCTLYKDKDNIPDYDEILKKLQLKSIGYLTVSRWINYLNYKYCKNNQNYYTDGHERDDVVRDSNDWLLDQYFDVDLRCYRW